MAYNGYIQTTFCYRHWLYKLFYKKFDNFIARYANYIVLGDLNFDMLIQSKCQSLHDICDIFYLSQMVKEPPCFM
jgi:hypothetical protein